MSGETKQRSAVERFVDSFLQERNIKWMLGIGVMILFGSSLMLVSREWSAWSAFWKFSVILGYTGVIFVAGEVSYFRLGLRTTGTVLMALTLLLIPLSFLAMNWLELTGGLAILGNAGLMLLVAVDAGFAFVASRRILGHFLRADRLEVVLSYWVLSVAGAIIPVVPAGLAPLGSLVLWGVFAVGAVKSNRHVFWLAEEHRLPRVFGFFPIALLGAQFLLIFALNFASHLAIEWIGFGCVLTAVPILLSADAVARVFQQRTGDLVRPLPWSITAPMFVGLTLGAIGLGMSATGFPFAHALVPSATLASCMLWLIARRTNQPGFIWAMLGTAMTAYQSCPVFFQQTVRLVLDSAAKAVKEDRLPYAFYGLTYLPFIALLVAAGRWAANRGDTLLARPIKRFSIGLSLLLFAVAFTHVKAAFFVSVVMTGVFVVQMFVFREKRLAIAAVGAWVAVALTVVPFSEQVLLVNVSRDLTLCLLAAAAGVLLVLGRRAVIGSTTADSIPGYVARVCRFAGTGVALLCAGGWVLAGLAAIAGTGAVPVVSAIMIGGLLLWRTMQSDEAGLPEVALSFVATAGVIAALGFDSEPRLVLSGLTFGMLALWIAGHTLSDVRDDEVPLARGATRVSLFVLSGLNLFVFGPLFLFGSLQYDAPLLSPMWIAGVPAILWTFDAARRRQVGFFAGAGAVGVLTMATAAALEIGHELTIFRYPAELLPVVWATTAIALLGIATAIGRRADRFASMGSAAPQRIVNPVAMIASAALVLLAMGTVFVLSTSIQNAMWSLASVAPIAGVIALQRRQPLSIRMENAQSIVRPVTMVALGTLGLIAIGSLFILSGPIRAAAVVAIVGLVGHGTLSRNSDVREFAVVVINWQIVCCVLQLLMPGLASPLSMTLSDLPPISLPLATILAISVTVVQTKAVRRLIQRDETSTNLDGKRSELLAAHAGILRLGIFGLLLESLLLSLTDFGAAQTVMAVFVFGSLAAAEFLAAFRTQSATRVWFGEVLVGLAVAYLAMFRVISFGHGVSMFAVMGASLGCWVLSRLAVRNATVRVIAEPLRITGLCLPIVTIGIGVFRHFVLPESLWLGMNSLALLMAAAFYFWRGVEDKQRGFIVGSGVTLNIAMCLLWSELSITDPQFFMVQLLKRELPTQFHNPLRYAGALVILVSPTFHIVGGSWTALVSLMVMSVLVVLLAIGLRTRALVYTGTAFLCADLVAMVVRGSIDHPNLIWIAGLLTGAGVIALAAFCENHRERLLAQLRLVTAELESWE